MPRRLCLLAGLLIGLGALTTGLAGANNLPDLGDASAAVLSPSEERHLGEKFIREARKQLDFLDDAEINGYVNGLGRKIAAHHISHQDEYHFYVINDNSLNAFAVPGGHIGIHTGLILATESEDELAAVLAHEITHISQRHMPRMIAAAKERALPTIAALLLGALIGGEAGEAAIALTSAASIQQQLNYTRSFEQEADRIGMQLLARAGYNPAAMPAFFERLQQWNRIYESDAPNFLRTHPVTSDRIAESRQRAERLPIPRPRDTSPFDHARAKIRVVTSADPAAAVGFFAHYLKDKRSTDNSAAHYGYALALLRSQRYDDARTALRPLTKARPDYLAYRLAQADIEAAAGRYQQALALYADIRQQFPEALAGTRQYAATLLQTGNPGKSAEVLRMALRKQQDDPGLYRLLATASGDSGEPVEAHRALAEYYYLNGELGAAIHQLQIAHRAAKGDYYVQSSVEARIAEIRQTVALYTDKPAPR